MREPSPTWAAVFLPGALPREGRVAFWAPDGDPPHGASDTLTVVGPAPTSADGPPGIRSRTVPALLLPVADALPSLIRARGL
nr:SNF2-related protein [Streptomyces tsukubensis NRRL18488]